MALVHVLERDNPLEKMRFLTSRPILGYLLCTLSACDEFVHACFDAFEGFCPVTRVRGCFFAEFTVRKLFSNLITLL